MKNVQQYHGEWWGGLPDGAGEHLKSNGNLLLIQVIFMLACLKMD